MYGLGNNAMTSSSTSSKNLNVESFVQNTSSKTPQLFSTSICLPLHESQGYEVIAATECPGISISGTTVMCLFSA